MVKPKSKKPMAQAMNDQALASMNPATPFGPGFTAPKGAANQAAPKVSRQMRIKTKK